MRTTPLLELRGVAFGYSARAVLTGVDLVIRPGQLVVVLGPNGSGKTTLFRGLAGLQPPLAGVMMCRATRLGYAPQRDQLDPAFPLRALDVVEMGGFGRLRGLRRPARGDRELARTCLDRLGLGELAGAAFASLSGGQRRRVLVARALMARPEVLLLDEPTSGVDHEAAGIIRKLASEMAAAGTAVLWVSHETGGPREVADQVLWVGGGRVRPLPPAFLADSGALAELFRTGAEGVDP